MRRWALMAVLFVGLLGCSRDTSPAGRAGLPSTGKVRIVPTRIREDSKSFSWLWTIIGERNWTTATTSPFDLKLSGSYPMNSREKTGGTHIWEARITITPSAGAGAGASYVMNVQLRGSNAAMSTSSTALDLGTGGSLTSAARAMETSDATESLPATVTLAVVGRKNITLRIAR